MRQIVVVDQHWGIGKKNDLLFSLPADMKHFRETTSGKVVVMGSNTLLSFRRKTFKKPRQYRFVAGRGETGGLHHRAGPCGSV